MSYLTIKETRTGFFLLILGLGEPSPAYLVNVPAVVFLGFHFKITNFFAGLKPMEVGNYKEEGRSQYITITARRQSTKLPVSNIFLLLFFRLQICGETRK